MFEGARDIDWAALGEARGLSEVPSLFEHLRSDKARARQFAIDQLADLLAPPAGSSRAGVAAVPFLVEAVLDETIEDRNEVAILLADLAAAGFHPDALRGGLRRDDMSTPVAELHDAVAARAPELMPLLEARKSAVRASAVLPLAFTGHASSFADAFEAEKNKTARASLLVGMGVNPTRGAKDLALLETAIDDDDEAIRFGAACGLTLASDELHAKSVDILAGAIVDGVKMPKSFPWCRGNVDGMAVVVLVGACMRSQNVGPLEALFAGGSNSRLAASILRTVFEPTDELRVPSTLSDIERALLRVVAMSNTAQDSLFFALNSHGFPAHRESLLRYAAGSDPGVLDTQADDGLPVWKHLRDAMDDRLDADGLHARLPASADPRALAEDALGGYMSLHLSFPRGTGGRLVASRGRSKLAGLCATLLRRRSSADAVRAWVEELSTDPESVGQDVCAAALVAWVDLADPTPEQIMDYAAVFRRAVLIGAEPLLRPILQRLDVPQREALIVAVGPDIVKDRSSGQWILVGCIPYLDLVPTKAAAQVIVDALIEMDYAPIDTALELLPKIGAPAKPVIAAALERDGISDAVRTALTGVTIG